MTLDLLTAPAMLTHIVEGFARVFVGLTAFWVFSGR